MEDNKCRPYSYHNFIFPFIWENTDQKTNEKSIIEKYLKSNHYWHEIDLENGNKEYLSKEEWVKLHARNEYFHLSFREAMLGYNNKFKTEKRIVSIYEFAPDLIKNGAEYIITKSYKAENKLAQKEFHLLLSGISLRIFNTGIAVLVLQCTNNQYSELQDIKWINDYGRRISLPFIPTGKVEDCIANSICADSLTVRIRGEEGQKDIVNITESFAERIREINQKNEFTMKDMQDQSCHICAWITGLLEGESRETSISDGHKNLFENMDIRPAMDERMYVMCLINSELECAKQRPEDMNKSQQELLYELAFVDAGSCTCQSDHMRESLLQECVYDRWMNYGTMYTITPQAFLCISNDLITQNSFQNMYLEMCVLPLVQRASLINFQDISLKLSKGLEQIGKALNTDRIKDLMDLQERFIAFQNQINLQEISSQEQAVDIYERLRKANFVEELTDALEGQLDALYDATNTNQDYSFNKWALILAVLALGLDIPTFLFRADGSLCFEASKPDLLTWLQQVGPHAAIFIMTGIVLAKIIRKFSRRKRK